MIRMRIVSAGFVTEFHSDHLVLMREFGCALSWPDGQKII